VRDVAKAIGQRGAGFEHPEFFLEWAILPTNDRLYTIISSPTRGVPICLSAADGASTKNNSAKP
jgi:hypothetical protein